MTNYKQLCAELLDELQYQTDWSITEELKERASRELAKPEPEGLTDEEIMALMPQQMHEDLAFAVQAMAEHAGTDSTRVKGAMRIMLNGHVVDLARAVLARWGGHHHSLFANAE